MRIGRYIADTLARLSIENVAGWIISMILSALATLWIANDPKFPVESRPGLAVWFLFIALVFGFLWVLIGLGFRYFRGNPKPPPQSEPRPESSHTALNHEVEAGVYEGPHHQLMLFVVDHLLPTVQAQIELQDAVIDLACANSTIASLAEEGLRRNWNTEDLQKGCSLLYGICGSPSEYVPMDQMIDSVDLVEKNYAKLIDQGLKLAGSEGIDLAKHPALTKLWEDWRQKHNALIDAYEPIKRESRCGKLFRPGRASRWGGEVPAVVS